MNVDSHSSIVKGNTNSVFFYYIKYLIVFIKTGLTLFLIELFLFICSLFLLKSVLFIKIEVVLLTIGAFLNLYLLMELFIWKQVENNKDSFSALDDMLLSIFNRRMNDKPIDLRIKGTVKLLEQIVSVNFLIIIFFLIVIVSE